jgi:hypothetical protein
MSLSPGTMNRIAIVVHFPTYLGTLLPLASRLERASTETDIVIYSDQGFGEHHLHYIKGEISQVYNRRLKKLDNDEILNVNSFCHRLWNFFKNLNTITRLLSALVSEYLAIRRIKSYLRQRKIGIVVLGGLIADHDMNTWVKVCKSKSVFTVVHPSWVADFKEPLSIIKSDLNQRLIVNTRFNKFIARKIPSGVVVSESTCYFRMPREVLLSKKFFGTLQNNPWILHSGNQDITLFESEAHLKLALDYGFLPENFEVTGSAMLDEICNARIGPVANWNNDSPSREILVLCAIPPDMFGSRSDFVQSFSSYIDFVSDLVQAVDTRFGPNVLYSLHPSSHKIRSLIEQLVGTRCLSIPVTEPLPNCDLYIASVSATIGLALAAGVDVINYDVYQYGYSDYLGEPRVQLVSNFDDFKSALDATSPRRSHPDSRWGILDGKRLERVESILMSNLAK